MEVARAIEDTSWRDEALRAVALSLAQAGQFGKMFLVLQPLNIYNYLISMAQGLPELEKLEPVLSLKVVREVVRIIGWVWPQWHKIYAILATAR